MQIRWVIIVLCTVGLTAIGISSLQAKNAESFQMESRVFSEGEEIPVKYTCEGEDMSVPLSWSGVPKEAESLALIMEDPDAPKGTWVHWVLYNISPQTPYLTANLRKLPQGAAMGVNSWGKQSYGGPCPPEGKHRYFFKLYALDTRLSVDQPDKKELVRAMKGHIVAQTQLMGTYEKKGKP